MSRQRHSEVATQQGRKRKAGERAHAASVTGCEVGHRHTNNGVFYGTTGELLSRGVGIVAKVAQSTDKIK